MFVILNLYLYDGCFFVMKDGLVKCIVGIVWSLVGIWDCIFCSFQGMEIVCCFIG